jgi:glycosyltransferase involved in cell wall biosynthesis
MRILYITPFAPDYRTGGGRHCYTNLRSLIEHPQVRSISYIGPSFDCGLKGLAHPKFRIELSRDFNFRDKIAALFTGSSSSLVSLFNEFRLANELDGFDFAFLESSRCGFIFNAAAGKIKTICCIHNVEVDYMRANRTFLHSLLSIFTKRHERLCLNLSDVLLIMHESDLNRLRTVYELSKELTYFYHPVCSFPPDRQIVPPMEREKVIFFSGSLDCHFNELGITSFVRECWPRVSETGYRLTIAGRNPSAKLQKILSKYRDIELIANPEDMEPLLRTASVAIVPDVSGTGMKLRVAEALSLGIPVVGTKGGLRGYSCVDRYGIAVDSIANMAEPLVMMLSNDHLLKELSANALEVWSELYSYDSFSNRLHELLFQLAKSKPHPKKDYKVQ